MHTPYQADQCHPLNKVVYFQLNAFDYSVPPAFLAKKLKETFLGYSGLLEHNEAAFQRLRIGTDISRHRTLGTELESKENFIKTQKADSQASKQRKISHSSKLKEFISTLEIPGTSPVFRTQSLLKRKV